MPQLDQSGSHNNAVQIAGDHNTVTIQSGAARPALDQRHRRQRPPKKDLDLLDPYRCPIDLVGRRHDLDSLTAWLDGPAPIAVQCRIGRAGSGKTRLALELCKTAEAKGWAAGFLAHDELTRFQEAGHVRDWAWPQPTLVVIDYAATSAQPLRKWLEDLADRDASGHPPLRLLLLERHASRDLGWWANLTRFTGFSTAGIEDLLDPPEPLELTRVSTAADRRALLEAIMAEAGKLTGKPVPPLPEPGTDPAFDAAIAQGTIELEPLYLLMAGLTAVQTGVPHVLSLTRTDLADRLAAAELDRLARLAKGHGIDPTLVQHLTACIGLMNGCPSDQLATLVTEEAAILGQTLVTGPDPVAHLLADTFTSDQPDRIDPIRPDLIGEAAILKAFKHHYRSPDWQATTVTRAYDRTGPETTATIIRIAQDFATGRLDHPSLLWLDRLADHVQDVVQVMAIADQLPEHTVSLRERAAAINRRIAHILRNASVHEPSCRPQLAMALNNLGIRLSALGLREEALLAIEGAVAIWRELATVRTNAFKPYLASALNNLGNGLSALGRLEDGMQATEEAVAIYRELAAARPDAHLPDLAGALNNLGNELSALGRREDALLATEEAVAIRRELAAARPDTFNPDLAGALNNLGNELSALGRREDALLATEEAVAIYRELAAARPDPFRPQLAMALDNLGNRFSALGRREEALLAAEEAVSIYRELAAAWPDAFEPDLARAFDNLGNGLSALGRREEALLATEEAVSICRELAASRPEPHLPDLATALNNLGIRFIALGRREEALLAIEEAVSIYRELAAARPDAFKPDLATSLATRANCLEALDRLDEALASNVEAIQALRPTFLAHPVAVVHWMQPMCFQYLERSEKLGLEPDIALFGPIIDAFRAPQQQSQSTEDQP